MKYGGSGTIHQTGEVNVEVDRTGKPVSVWFRCLALPFTADVVDDDRAEDMRDMYKESMGSIEEIDITKPGEASYKEMNLKGNMHLLPGNILFISLSNEDAEKLANAPHFLEKEVFLRVVTR